MRIISGMKKPRIQRIPGFYGEKLIEGVVLKELTFYADERGFLLEIMRLDDANMKSANIKQIIASYSYPGVIKGWHLHTKQEDRLVCINGMIKLVLYDYRQDSPTYGQINEIFMGDRYPRAVFIPPGVFHGVKNIGQNIAIVIGMPSLFYDPDNVDEVRVHPLDNDIVPYNWECRME